ncbi:neural cell adhesion molecule 2-like isoform X2 [Oratosquilla oratoria]|uniref:neural cell adhesion molecule 2-like isoform X2 n=1 Tax=Oratosquilla oratoria TaxID=337810 RepID=UPI003F76DAA9
MRSSAKWNDLVLMMVVLTSMSSFASTAVQGTHMVVGVAGQVTELPCPLQADTPKDRAILALWYREGQRLPVYSYDARGSASLHQPDKKLMANRGSFLTNTSPAVLRLNPVQVDDEGIYTCRVDYFSSPTHNNVVNLTVIEPPVKMEVYSSTGQDVIDRVGPINEGTPVTLTCMVLGGRPRPTVTWWLDRVMVQKHSELTHDGRMRSDLNLPEVTRVDHLKNYTCRAHNNNQQEPLHRTITVDMNLRPLSVDIKVPAKHLIAGVQYSFICESKGSKPSAKITWFLDNERVDNLRTQTRPLPGDMTKGVVTIVPKDTDDKKPLLCQAENKEIKRSAIKKTVHLSVHYAPVVHLSLGKNLNPSEIRQGGDVYFECDVRANPEPYKIEWFKNSEIIEQNRTGGIILSSNSLVLQKVRRESAGEYTCSATNQHGSQLSLPVRLDVMYPPECMMDQPTVLAVGRGEQVNISCRVASNPPRATFYWRLNGSERIQSLPGVSTAWGHLASSYPFIGTSEKDYGNLLCWANNSIGEQEKPCVFQMIPAGPPSSPENCEIHNHTDKTIEVSCEQGFDGGMRQAFLGEVYDGSGALHLNLTSDDPKFSVHSLEPGTTYEIRVSAVNAKGRSDPVAITAYTLKVAEKRMVDDTKSLLYSPLIIVFISIVGVFLIIILVLVLITRRRKNNASSSSSTTSTAGITAAGVTTVTPSNTNANSTRNIPPSSPNKPPNEVERIEEKGEEVKKRKKKVVVIENGPMGDEGRRREESHSDLASKDATLEYKETIPLANGSAGYYNSIGKTSLPTGAASTTPSTSSLALRSPRSSLILHQHQQEQQQPQHLDPYPLSQYQQPYQPQLRSPGAPRMYRRSLAGPPSELGFAPEDYFLSGGMGDPLGDIRGSFRSSIDGHREGLNALGGLGDGGMGMGMSEDVDYTQYSNTLPRQRPSGADKYLTLQKLRHNPKYVVRTQPCDAGDESFV